MDSMADDSTIVVSPNRPLTRQAEAALEEYGVIERLEAQDVETDVRGVGDETVIGLEVEDRPPEDVLESNELIVEEEPIEVWETDRQEIRIYPTRVVATRDGEINMDPEQAAAEARDQDRFEPVDVPVDSQFGPAYPDDDPEAIAQRFRDDNPMVGRWSAVLPEQHNEDEAWSVTGVTSQKELLVQYRSPPEGDGAIFVNVWEDEDTDGDTYYDVDAEATGDIGFSGGPTLIGMDATIEEALEEARGWMDSRQATTSYPAFEGEVTTGMLKPALNAAIRFGSNAAIIEASESGIEILSRFNDQVSVEIPAESFDTYTLLASGTAVFNLRDLWDDVVDDLNYSSTLRMESKNREFTATGTNASAERTQTLSHRASQPEYGYSVPAGAAQFITEASEFGRIVYAADKINGDSTTAIGIKNSPTGRAFLSVQAPDTPDTFTGIIDATSPLGEAISAVQLSTLVELTKSTVTARPSSTQYTFNIEDSGPITVVYDQGTAGRDLTVEVTLRPSGLEDLEQFDFTLPDGDKLRGIPSPTVSETEIDLGPMRTKLSKKDVRERIVGAATAGVEVESKWTDNNKVLVGVRWRRDVVRGDEDLVADDTDGQRLEMVPVSDVYIGRPNSGETAEAFLARVVAGIDAAVKNPAMLDTDAVNIERRRVNSEYDLDLPMFGEGDPTRPGETALTADEMRSSDDGSDGADDAGGDLDDGVIPVPDRVDTGRWDVAVVARPDAPFREQHEAVRFPDEARGNPDIEITDDFMESAEEAVRGVPAWQYEDGDVMWVGSVDKDVRRGSVLRASTFEPGVGLLEQRTTDDDGNLTVTASDGWAAIHPKSLLDADEGDLQSGWNTAPILDNSSRATFHVGWPGGRKYHYREMRGPPYFVYEFDDESGQPLLQEGLGTNSDPGRKHYASIYRKPDGDEIIGLKPDTESGPKPSEPAFKSEYADRFEFDPYLGSGGDVEDIIGDDVLIRRSSGVVVETEALGLDGGTGFTVGDRAAVDGKYIIPPSPNHDDSTIELVAVQRADTDMEDAESEDSDEVSDDFGKTVEGTFADEVIEAGEMEETVVDPEDDDTFELAVFVSENTRGFQTGTPRARIRTEPLIDRDADPNNVRRAIKKAAIEPFEGMGVRFFGRDDPIGTAIVRGGEMVEDDATGAMVLADPDRLVSLEFDVQTPPPEAESGLVDGILDAYPGFNTPQAESLAEYVRSPGEIAQFTPKALMAIEGIADGTVGKIVGSGFTSTVPVGEQMPDDGPVEQEYEKSFAEKVREEEAADDGPRIEETNTGPFSGGAAGEIQVGQSTVPVPSPDLSGWSQVVFRTREGQSAPDAGGVAAVYISSDQRTVLVVEGSVVSNKWKMVAYRHESQIRPSGSLQTLKSGVGDSDSDRLVLTSGNVAGASSQGIIEDNWASSQEAAEQIRERVSPSGMFSWEQEFDEDIQTFEVTADAFGQLNFQRGDDGQRFPYMLEDEVASEVADTIGDVADYRPASVEEMAGVMDAGDEPVVAVVDVDVGPAPQRDEVITDIAIQEPDYPEPEDDDDMGRAFPDVSDDDLAALAAEFGESESVLNGTVQEVREVTDGPAAGDMVMAGYTPNQDDVIRDVRVRPIDVSADDFDYVDDADRMVVPDTQVSAAAAKMSSDPVERYGFDSIEELLNALLSGETPTRVIGDPDRVQDDAEQLFSRWLLQEYDIPTQAANVLSGRLNGPQDASRLEQMSREDLLSIRGVGDSTADAIMEAVGTASASGTEVGPRDNDPEDIIPESLLNEIPADAGVFRQLFPALSDEAVQSLAAFDMTVGEVLQMEVFSWIETTSGIGRETIERIVDTDVVDTSRPFIDHLTEPLPEPDSVTLEQALDRQGGTPFAVIDDDEYFEVVVKELNGSLGYVLEDDGELSPDIQVEARKRVLDAFGIPEDPDGYAAAFEPGDVAARVYVDDEGNPDGFSTGMGEELLSERASEFIDVLVRVESQTPRGRSEFEVVRADDIAALADVPADIERRLLSAADEGFSQAEFTPGTVVGEAEIEVFQSGDAEIHRVDWTRGVERLRELSGGRSAPASLSTKAGFIRTEDEGSFVRWKAKGKSRGMDVYRSIIARSPEGEGWELAVYEGVPGDDPSVEDHTLLLDGLGPRDSVIADAEAWMASNAVDTVADDIVDRFPDITYEDAQALADTYSSLSTILRLSNDDLAKVMTEDDPEDIFGAPTALAKPRLVGRMKTAFPDATESEAETLASEFDSPKAAVEAGVEGIQQIDVRTKVVRPEVGSDLRSFARAFPGLSRDQLETLQDSRDTPREAFGLSDDALEILGIGPEDFRVGSGEPAVGPGGAGADGDTEAIEQTEDVETSPDEDPFDAAEDDDGVSVSEGDYFRTGNGTVFRVSRIDRGVANLTRPAADDQTFDTAESVSDIEQALDSGAFEMVGPDAEDRGPMGDDEEVAEEPDEEPDEDVDESERFSNPPYDRETVEEIVTEATENTRVRTRYYGDDEQLAEIMLTPTAGAAFPVQDDDDGSAKRQISIPAGGKTQLEAINEAVSTWDDYQKPAAVDMPLLEAKRTGINKQHPDLNLPTYNAESESGQQQTDEQQTDEFEEDAPGVSPRSSGDDSGGGGTGGEGRSIEDVETVPIQARASGYVADAPVSDPVATNINQQVDQVLGDSDQFDPGTRVGEAFVENGEVAIRVEEGERILDAKMESEDMASRTPDFDMDAPLTADRVEEAFPRLIGSLGSVIAPEFDSLDDLVTSPVSDVLDIYGVGTGSVSRMLDVGSIAEDKSIVEQRDRPLGVAEDVPDDTPMPDIRSGEDVDADLPEGVSGGQIDTVVDIPDTAPLGEKWIGRQIQRGNRVQPNRYTDNPIVEIVFPKRISEQVRNVVSRNDISRGGGNRAAVVNPSFRDELPEESASLRAMQFLLADLGDLRSSGYDLNSIFAALSGRLVVATKAPSVRATIRFP